MCNLFLTEQGTSPTYYFFGGEGANLRSCMADFFDLMAYIYYADIRTQRQGEFQIDIVVPVENLDTFCQIEREINLLVNFMAGDVGNDQWNISFTEFKRGESQDVPEPAAQLTLDLGNSFDHVTLLSGGLDSFCGAFFDLITSEKTPLFVSYKTNNIEIGRVKNHIIPFLKEQNKNISLKDFTINQVKKLHFSQRTRSLLFMALAVVTAEQHKLTSVRLYENGILSLNPSFGSRFTTKTTHPRVIKLINDILGHIGSSISIYHPFLFRTKGEMVADLSREFIEKINSTMTCGQSRQNPNFRAEDGHCGACVPCLLRQISIVSNSLQSHDVSYNRSYLENHALYSDFFSSLSYFKRFRGHISRKTIVDQIFIHSSYYTQSNYLEETNRMLEKFGAEIDIYIDWIENKMRA